MPLPRLLPYIALCILLFGCLDGSSGESKQDDGHPSPIGVPSSTSTPTGLGGPATGEPVGDSRSGADTSSGRTDSSVGGKTDHGASLPLANGQLVWRTLTVAPSDGSPPVPRRYGAYLPKGAQAHRPLPLVLVAHGYAMSAEGMVQITGYPALADQEGFAVAFLEGQTNRPPYHPTFAGPGPWNVGKNVRGPGHDVEGVADDLAYVKALTQDVATLQAIDERHVFLTGFSMGAYFTHHAGCALGAPWVRGLAPSGGSTYAFQDQCKQGPMPVILFHGTSDTVIGPSWGRQSRDEWTAKNGCSQEVDVVPILGGHCERHRGCPADGQVEMCFFDKMTHAWAGGTPAPIPQAEILASLTQVDPKAADLMRGIVEGVLAQDTAIRAMLTLLGDYPKLASIPGQFPLWHYTLSATAYASTAELSWRFWKKHAW